MTHITDAMWDFADTLSRAPSANFEREITSIMKSTFMALLLVCLASVLSAQWNDAYTTQLALSFFAYDSAAGAAAHSSSGDQEKRAAHLPVRVYGQGGDESVSFLVIQAPLTWESGTLTGVSTGAVPPTSFSNGLCFGGLGDYEVHEFSTWSEAKSYYENGMSSFGTFVKPHAYGPLATPRGSYIVVHPVVHAACQ